MGKNLRGESDYEQYHYIGRKRAKGWQYRLVLKFFHLGDAGMVLVQGTKDIGDVKNTDGLDRAWRIGDTG